MLQKKNYLVLSGSCYFARFFRSKSNELLVTHQSYSHLGRTYIAPYKSVNVDQEGVLRFKFWKANENLKGSSFDVVQSPTDPYFQNVLDVSEGVIFETSLKLPIKSPSNPLLWSGFIIEMGTAKQNKTVTFISINDEGVCNIGEINSPYDVNATSIHTWNRELGLSEGKIVSIRLLYRRDMLELYLEDFLLPVYLISKKSSGRVGLIPNSAKKLFSQVNGWKMSLPGEPIDIAVNGVASCSGFYKNSTTYSCEKANDGDLSTRWSSELPYDGLPRWWYVDLGTVTQVNEVRIVWEKAYAKGYELQVASELGREASTWTTFYNQTDGKGNTETISGISISGRHFRIFCYERFSGSAWGFSIFEFMLFNNTQT